MVLLSESYEAPLGSFKRLSYLACTLALKAGHLAAHPNVPRPFGDSHVVVRSPRSRSASTFLWECQLVDSCICLEAGSLLRPAVGFLGRHFAEGLSLSPRAARTNCFLTSIGQGKSCIVITHVFLVSLSVWIIIFAGERLV